MRRASTLFCERTTLYARKLGVAVPRVSLSSARTRWGSCSEKGGIRINWRLIHLPLTLIDYVVAHELAHLIEMNHSQRFWAVVASVYPEWRAARRELKSRAAVMPII
jgi:predicted metal-dependent hydrolase